MRSENSNDETGRDSSQLIPMDRYNIDKKIVELEHGILSASGPQD